MANPTVQEEPRLPAWWAFVKTLGVAEDYERHDNLPAKVAVTRTRGCWSKDGYGVQLFLDVAAEGGVSHWRVFMPKRHQHFTDILAGRGLLSIGTDGRCLVVEIGGEQG